MIWTITRAETDAGQVFDLLKHHRLLPESEQVSAAICNSLGRGERHTITDGESLVANVYVTLDGPTGIAQLDLVPVTKYFRSEFDEPLRGVMIPLLASLFDDRGARRIEASVPETRSRTRRALCSIGFKPEGRCREAVVLFGKVPEDIRMLGLLPQYMKTEESEQ